MCPEVEHRCMKFRVGRGPWGSVHFCHFRSNDTEAQRGKPTWLKWALANQGPHGSPEPKRFILMHHDIQDIGATTALANQSSPLGSLPSISPTFSPILSSTWLSSGPLLLLCSPSLFPLPSSRHLVKYHWGCRYIKEILTVKGVGWINNKWKKSRKKTLFTGGKTKCLGSLRWLILVEELEEASLRRWRWHWAKTLIKNLFHRKRNGKGRSGSAWTKAWRMKYVSNFCEYGEGAGRQTP